MPRVPPRFASFAAALLVAASLGWPPAAADAPGFPFTNEPGSPVASAIAFLRTHQAADGGIGGIAISAWAAIAAVHAGDDPAAWRAAPDAPSLTQHLVDAGAAQAPAMLATDLARHTLALAFAGVDARTAGGVDYVALLEARFDGTQLGDAGLMHDDYFGLLALSAAGGADATVATLMGWILANQMPDGGWSWRPVASTDAFSVAFGPTSDVDSTAAALMALSAAGVASDAPSVAFGLAFIKTHQYVDGGHGNSIVFDSLFGTPQESNTASTSWAVAAIGATGGDAAGADWTTPTGANPVAYLRSMQADDGGFAWTASLPGGFTPGTDVWMTTYAVTALTGGTYVLG